MTVQQLVRELDLLINKDLSEVWDNDGAMVVPCPDAEVKRVLCALDCTSVTINKAKELGCNVIVTHHPLIFKPLSSLCADDSVGKRVLECVKSGIAVLSYHTRLDSMAGGVNDTLCEKLGINNTSAFLPYGRIGNVEEMPFKDFALKVASSLGLEMSDLTLVKSCDKVSKVAVVSGSGKDEILSALVAGADTFVTGEVMHNHYIDCRELGLNLICATHYGTERIVVPVLAGMIEKFAPCCVYEFVKEEEYGI